MCLIATRETIRFTVIGTLPPSTSSWVTLPVMMKLSRALLWSSVAFSFSSVRLFTVVAGAFTTAQMVFSPADTVTVTEVAAPAG